MPAYFHQALKLWYNDILLLHTTVRLINIRLSKNSTRAKSRKQDSNI